MEAIVIVSDGRKEGVDEQSNAQCSSTVSLMRILVDDKSNDSGKEDRWLANKPNNGQRNNSQPNNG